MNINDNLMINLKNNLFNENSIKKYSNNFILTPQKRVKLERYIERVQNNEFKGETKGYPAFLKFLEDILDYEEDKHISFDDNVDIGSDRVEFALKDNDGKFMVIELKGQNADLDQPQNRANDKRSPVEQAFGYAQHSSKKSGLVQWILVSNYKEFRLYNYEKRLGEYISFNVEDLLKDDIFKYFMFSFSKESHVDLKAINDVVNEIYIEKTQLANNFYKLFNETRLMIYKELNELHGMDKNDAISNAQKILDRFIFISFASSRKLLPENIVRNTLLNRITNEDIREYEIWRDLNYLFKDVNKGNKDRNISEYNGGLFKDDLKDIKLKDIIKDTNFFKDVYQKWNFKEFEERLKKEIKPSILKRINPIYINLLIISYFDFSEEKKEDTKHKLDIEILGHIFENSIGDIEELKEDSKGRRKKEGIFYTPDYITDYICKNTIIPYLSSSGNVNTIDELLKEFSAGREVEKLDEKLKNIKIIDPACGSGAFLNKATDILLDIHKGIFEIKKGYKTSIPMRVGKGKGRKTENVQHMDIGVYVFDDLSKRREILLDNIYGVDLNPESVEITKLSLFLKVCEKDKILPAIDNNILCGNSLIDNPDFTNKPFKWKKEFKEIFDEGGFDVVIGNPPYINIELIEKKQLPYLKKNFKSASYGRIDLYLLFMEKAIDLLNKGGLTSFIIPNKFCNHKYARILREIILNNHKIEKVIDLSEFKIFKDASVKNIIYIFRKCIADSDSTMELIKPSRKAIEENKIEGKTTKINQYLFNEIPQKRFRLDLTSDNYSIATKIDKLSLKLELICYTSFGLQPGNLKRFVFNKNENPERERENPNVIKEFIRGRNINRYYIDYTGDLVFYLPEKLHRPAFPELFENKKIVVSRIAQNIRASYDISKYYCDKTTVEALPYCYLLDVDPSVLKQRGIKLTEDVINRSKNYDSRYILAFLNSKIINFYFKLIISDGIDVYPDNIRNIPIYPGISTQQKPFIEKADMMLQLNNDLFDEIHEFKDWLQRTHKIEKFSNRLNKYYELSFDDFLVELKKKKVDIKLRKTQELLKNEFEESIKVINPLLQQIKETDSEIDQMVYDLYGLTNEEIKIIEDNI